MRLDLFLKVSRLVKSRSIAQELCDAGLVQVNGVAARSSKDVKVGDKLAIRRRTRLSEYSVIAVPSQKQVSKDKAAELYSILSETMLPVD